MKNLTITKILILVILLLLIPLVAMQFSAEVSWGVLDFAVAALILFVSFTAINFLYRKIKNKKARTISILLLILLLLILWADLAVGLFDFPWSGS